MEVVLVILYLLLPRMMVFGEFEADTEVESSVSSCWIVVVRSLSKP
jgi:hypothetical protein